MNVLKSIDKWIMRTMCLLLLAAAVLGPRTFAHGQWAGDRVAVAGDEQGPDRPATPEDGEQPAADAAIPSKNMLQIIKAGGILMLPILLCSFILLVFVFERMIALRRRRVVPRPFVKRFLHQLRQGELNREQALALCEENKSPVAEVFGGAVRKWGRPAVEVEQAVLDSGERAVTGLRRYVRVFNAVATVSPLLGLLGTVFGMIAAFNEIATADAMGRPEQLAAGISEALITTAAGLTVAIPALCCYLFFISRVDQLVVQIDALGQEVVEVISAEGLQAANQPKASRASRRDAA
ncbi:MAG: MotA/TolQ/ExbB proton channel family protein [Pirellulales bacterium]